MTVYDFDRREMLKFVPAVAASLLEVGCDTGRFGAQVRMLHPEIELVGVEPDATAAVAARMIFDEVVCGTFPSVATAVARPEGYDVIVFNDVLEHLERTEEALDAAREMLSPTGVVIASIPNVRHISASGPLLVRGEWRYSEIGVLDSTHLRFFTESTIRRTFEERGWDVEQLEAVRSCYRLTDPQAPRWARLLGWATRGASDPFFVLQYGVSARPSR